LNYFVIDFEYNQPYDFKKNGPSNPNKAMPFEIVQIGIIKLNEQLEVKGRRNYYVKPQLYKRIHPYVARITGFNNKTFENGKSFEIVYRSFIRFLGREKAVFCTWGGADVRELYRNTLFYSLKDKPLPKRFIDVQKLVSRHLNNGKNCIGLEKAVEAMSIAKSLPFHNAFNDALYTSELFRQIKPIIKPDKKGRIRIMQRFNVQKLKQQLRKINYE